MKILLCVAGMPYAEAAISLGSIVAGLTQSPVTLLHVIRRKEDRAAGERILAAARENLPGLTVDTRIRRGDPIRQIIAEVRKGKYDLMIIGARQGGGLTQQLLGSVAQKIVRRIPTSVLIAREADVHISGAGDAAIHATDRLRGRISGVGNLDYYGDPAETDTHVSGMGSIKRK